MEKIKLDQFLDFKFISGLTANQSETLMAFMVAKAHLDKNDYFYDLYLSDGQKHTKLLSLKNKNQFIWESEDSLLFPYAINKKEEKAQKEKRSIYYRYTISTKKLEKAYEFSFPATIHAVLNNQKLLLLAKLTKDEHHLYLDSVDDRKKVIEDAKKKALYEDINEIPFYSNGVGFVANVRNQLFLYDMNEKSVKPLVDNDFSVNQVCVSSDLNLIYYSGQQMTGVRSLFTHIYSFNVHQMHTEILYHENDFAISNMYLLDQHVIVAASDMKEYGMNQNRDFYQIVHKKLVLLSEFGKSINSSVGSDVKLGVQRNDLDLNHKLYFVSTIDDHAELYVLNELGLIQPAYIFNGSIDGLCTINKTIYVNGLYRQKLQEIYALDLNMHTQKQITKFNQSVLKSSYIAKPKEYIVKYSTHEVKGWVLYPYMYNPLKKYPAILDIHGGPKTVYGKTYFHEMQYWASEGYFVLFANPRGSDGKGNEFADIRGKYGTIDYDDLMAFTNLVIRKNEAIDQERLFVTGGSYGGFMTNWIVGQTNRFKAAATQRSISNWLSFHGTSDIGFYFSQDQTDGHPMSDTTKLWDQSPIKFALSMKTPLLFIHSDQDYRCPIEQAMQLYTILKQNGVKTKLVWFKGENHELSRSGKPQARVKRLEEITNWFSQY